VSIISNDKDNNNNQIENQVNIINENENNEINTENNTINKNKIVNEEKDAIITSAVVDTNNIFSPTSTSTSTSTSIQVAKTSILYLLQNMVKMGATKNLIGEKAIKKIAETVNLIVHYPDYTVLKSSNKFLYHEKLLILVSTVLLQNDEKNKIPVIIKDEERKNFQSSSSLSESHSNGQGERRSIIITENKIDNKSQLESENKNENIDICKLQDGQICVDKIESKTEIVNDNEISCDENWSETVYDLLLQLLNN
jgi:hypothetical protein